MGDAGMAQRVSFFTNAFLGFQLADATTAAIRLGTHLDHDLLLLHEQFRNAERTGVVTLNRTVPAEAPENGESVRFQAELKAHFRDSLLRSLVSTPARTPLGIALKLAVACDLDGRLSEAQEAAETLSASHVIVAALADAMALSRLLPNENQPPCRTH
jgi:hypothetical protein